MPLLPIDLQTMFSHMNQVGKDQAHQKEATPLDQSLQGLEIAKDSREKDTTVNQTDQVGEGLENIKDEENEKGNMQENEKKKRKKEEKESEKKEVYKEPYLGHHIDITG